MKRSNLVWSIVLLLSLLLAACGGESAVDGVGEPAGSAAGAVTDTGDVETAGAEHDEDGMEEMAEEAVMPDSAAVEAPAWMTRTLTDATTGETFTLADFAGKTVFVEPMATWCTNCRRQLTDVKFAQANLDPEEVVIVGLSIETNLSDQDLALFASQADFNWTWAVATPELLRDLVATFGQSVTNAPATPHFIIRPDGTFTDLDTGFESPDELTAQIEAAGQGS